MKFLRLCGAYLAAVLATTVLGSVLQTQVNLADLAGIGVPIDAATRLQVTARDLAGFTPLFGALVAVGLLIAFVVTGVIRRWLQPGRTWLYALAGTTALATALLGVEAWFGVAVVSACRSAGGLALLLASGAAGGWVFAKLTPPPQA